MKIIKSFKLFENRYYTYSDFEKSSYFKSPEDFYKDIQITLKTILNGYCEISNIEDMSDPSKGIKFEVTLSTGDIIHVYKKSTFRGQYVYFLNRKPIDENNITEYFYNKLPDLKKYILSCDAYDPNYRFTDDARVYQRGTRNRDSMISLYSGLSEEDKLKAYEYYSSLGKNEKIPFEIFKGA
jgi:hypothetical protein